MNVHFCGEGVTSTPCPNQAGFVDCKTVYYVRGAGDGTLTSTSFASCIGMVLYRPDGGYGLVAHFWGIEEDPCQAAEDIAREFLDYAQVEPGPRYGPLSWPVNALVFGGNPAAQNVEFPQATRAKQQLRLQNLKFRLQKSLPISVREDLLAHSDVTLHLADGQVTGKEKFTVDTLGGGGRARAASH